MKRSEASGKNILPLTWALKRTRYPDCRIRKYKARFCVRGDKQVYSVEKSRGKRSVVMVRIMTVYVFSDLADSVGKYLC